MPHFDDLKKEMESLLDFGRQNPIVIMVGFVLLFAVPMVLFKDKLVSVGQNFSNNPKEKKKSELLLQSIFPPLVGVFSLFSGAPAWFGGLLILFGLGSFGYLVFLKKREGE